MADPTSGKHPSHQAYPVGTKVVVDTPAPEVIPDTVAPANPRGWLPELKKIYTLPPGMQQGSAFHRAMQPVLNGASFQQPTGWPTWTVEQQAKYLDENYPKEKV